MISASKGFAANGRSDSPDISADSRFIVYTSDATNLVPGDNNNAPDIFVFDRITGVTSLLTLNKSHSSGGNQRSWAPRFAGDGRTILFSSRASDLVAGDFNQSVDLFSYSFLFANVTANGAGQGPTISWPAIPDQSYKVQYKDDLNESAWTDLGGSVVISNGVGSIQDFAPAASRIYRVISL